MALPHEVDHRRNALDLMRDADFAVDAREGVLDRHAHGVRSARNDERIIGKLRKGDGIAARGLTQGSAFERCDQEKLIIEQRLHIDRGRGGRVVHQRAIHPAERQPFENIGR